MWRPSSSSGGALGGWSDGGCGGTTPVTFIPSPALFHARREGGWTGIGGIRKAGVADALTVSNGVCGIIAIYLLITQAPDITYGSALILLGFVFDGADGWAARRFGTKHEYGRHLDSVSDAITFCAAPAVMVAVVFTGGFDGDAFDANRRRMNRRPRPRRYLSDCGAFLRTAMVQLCHRYCASRR